MNALIDAAVDHSRTVLLILALLLIAGISTYINIPKEADPDVDIPVLYVDVALDGISPEDADKLLVVPLERELESIAGVDRIESVAFEGGASVTLEFGAGFDSDIALRDVRDATERAASALPKKADKPEVVEINTSQFPQLVIGLGGGIPERALYSIADELKNELESVDGVLEVAVYGKREEMVELIVDPQTLESYNVSQFNLANAVQRNNELVAAGIMDSGVGRFALKVPGVIQSADELLNLPLKSVNGRVVRIRDIASVRRVYKDADSVARVDGKPSVTMEVIKRSGANIIDIIDQVKLVVQEQQVDWPESVDVSYFGDRSIEIRDMLNDLENSILIAVLLVVVVIIGALGVRSAGLVAVAIPGSFVIGMLVISMLGLTVNIVVLFSLIMAVGILVDGTIVVSEYADRRMIARIPKAQAYKQAAKQMSWPIIASTATTLAAFMPLLFWPGVVGDFMKYLPITLIATLSASLLMALIFVPTLGGLIGKPRILSTPAIMNMAYADKGNLNKLSGFTGRYTRFLFWAIQFPGSVLLFVLAVLFGIGVAYFKMGHGTEFFPDVEPKQAYVSILARGDLAVKERDAILTTVESEILKIAEIETVYAYTDLGDNDVVASMTLEFKDWDKRERRVDDILAQIRRLEQSMPGLRLDIQKDNAGPGGDEKPIQLAFSSQDNAAAKNALLQLKRWMEQSNGYTDIDTSLPLPGLEWNVKVNREEAGRFGADISLIGTFVQLVTTGLKLSTYRPEDSTDELDIVVRFPADKRKLSQLQDLRIATINGYVPLSNFASIEPAQKVSLLRRVDGRIVYQLMASPQARAGEQVINFGQLANERLDELHSLIPTLDINPAVDVRFEGQDQDQQESESFLIMAMIFAVFIMAIILVTQFNSFYQALLVLVAVVLSLGGVFIGLLLMGEPFGIIMSGVGVISLAGIVVNNNIVLIDTFNTLSKQGLPVKEAIVRTGAQRLRPVMLTTITTVLGLMPMVLKMNIDLVGRQISFGSPSTQWWSQLATAVAGGLTFATVLTLVLTPCLLAYPSLIRERRLAKRQHNRRVQTA